MSCVYMKVLWVNNNNSLASMSIDDGFETQPLTFNLMEHDHIDHFMVPNNVKCVVDECQLDLRHFYKASNMDRAWQMIKGTLDWIDAITLELEQKIRRKKYKANLKKAYCTPCLHSPLLKRFHCHDGHVNQGQWKLLVQLWDTVDAQEQANGSKSSCITFFMLTHTRKNEESVDARLAAIIDDFNTKLKMYEDRNEIITDEFRHIVYADVLGPERNNRVRRFGTGVV
ncbi:hypothetical protein DVH24_023880 [Malus domestica]|uniref:Uncharacterized protein n=1 Tax=Malus domestica TaxID=3750 RepID=A0A498JGC4_MALDO|nr:hypothetical protein DVH24_023880 [Malus domestica]